MKRRRRPHLFRRVTAVLAASATAMAVAGVYAPPAGADADDPGIAQLRQLVADVAALTSTLGTVGRLAEQVPTVGVSAGQATDFTDLVAKTLQAPLAGVQHWGDLARTYAVDDAARGRTGSLVVTRADDGADGHVVDVDVDVTRTLAPQPFSFVDPQVSLSSPTGVTVKARTTFSLRFVVEKRPGTGAFVPYLAADAANAPTFDVAVEADIPTGTTLKAAVGILGVDLTETSPDTSPDAALRLRGTVSDPDGDGRLYAQGPAGTPGELAGAGAAEGLFAFGPSPTGAGSVALQLRLQAVPNTDIVLPGVDAEVNVSWPDVSAGTPSVSATGLDPVSAFMNLSTRDLADLLGQVGSTITSGQRDNGGNLPLPFLSGTFADAVKASELLLAFLDEWVVQAPEPGQPAGPIATGTPRFTSLQDLITRLNATMAVDGTPLMTGADIVAMVTGYDPTTGRLPIRLELARTAPAPVDVVEDTVASSGVGVYGPTTLTAASAFPADLAGRRVTAGSSGGTVQSVSGATLTLAEPWTGGQPENGTPYAIAGPQVDAGSVNLGDLLQSGGKGVGDANAVRPTAKVTPSYRVVLDLALDLSAPRTGAACASDGGSACPYERTGPDGSSTVVTSEPLPVERLLLKNTGTLLSADFPITAAIDLNARAGFLAVRAQGSVKVCRSATGVTCSETGGSPMLAVTLTTVPGDPTDGYVPVRRFFDTLVAADGTPQRFSATSSVGAVLSGSLSVPDAPDFLAGATAGFTGRWDRVGTGSPTIDATDLSELTAFDVDVDDPQALLGAVIRVLQLLDEQLASGGGTGPLSTTIPLVDRSLGDFLGGDESGGGATATYPTADDDQGVLRTRLVDTSRTGGRAFPAELAGRSLLVGTQAAVVLRRIDGTTLELSTDPAAAPAAGTPYFLRSELADAISLLTGDAPDTLQELVRRLDEALGADSPVRFRTKVVDGSSALVVDVDWARSFATSSPVKLALDGATLAGAAAEGQAAVAVAAQVDVDLVVPLVEGLPSALQVLDTSQISVDANATVDGSISASIGPLSIAVGKPAAASPTDAERASARARYKLAFQKAGATGLPVSISSFLTDVAPVVNGYDGGVTCGETPADTDDDLALCARLPLFVGSGTSYSPAGIPDIALRLPKTGSDLFSTAGTVSATDPRLRLVTPTAAQLSAAFQALLLDFGMIGDGLDAFLALVEDGLLEAALDGKLPLVGGDLQAGADFVGDLRTELDALFAQVEAVDGGRLPSVATVQQLLDTEFQKALAEAGANPQDFSLDLTCTLPSADVTSATAVTTGAVPVEYAVLATGTSGASEVTTTPGTSMSVLAAETSTVNIAFTGSEAATGYVLIRRKSGGAYEQVKTLAAGTTTTSDTVDSASTAVTVPTEPALVTVCTGIDMTDLQGVQIRADIGTGDPNATTSTGEIAGCDTLDVPDPGVDEECLSATLPLDIGIPGLSLRAARGEDGGPGGLTAKLGYRIHLALELDRTNGFSLITEDADTGGSATPEIAIGTSVDLTTPGVKPAGGAAGTPALAAELAFLKIGVYEDGPVDVPGFAARFAIDLKAPGDDDCFDGCATPDRSARLDFADLQSADSASDVVRSQLQLEAHLRWFLKAEIESALPGVQATFVLDWATSFDPSGGTPADVLAMRGQDLVIGFEDVGISAGGFLSQVLGPIVTQVKSVTGPLQPVVDTLYAPLPVLSDLSKLAGGGDVTLITLAKTFSTLADGPDLEFIDTVAALITFVNNLPEGDENLVIPIGSFTVLGEEALATEVTPDSGGDLIEGVEDVVQDLGLELDQATTNGKASLAGDDSAAATSGFAFPVFENPASIFDLLMGQDIDLVTFDSGDLTLGFTWRQSFGPVYAPPPVFITLSGSASVTARIYAGFDTYGIRKAFEADPDRSALQGIAQVLDGLFFFSTEDDGTPLPVITLFGEIAAGAAVSAVIITVGIEGGIRLTVAFSWNDPNGDGKFRLFEFGQVALRNPICLFQVSGQLTLFLRLYITIGVSIFSVSFDFTLVEITLLDFSAKPDCEPPPPLLGGTTGDTLVLFAGKLGQGPRGDATWSNVRDGEATGDVFKVTALHTYDPAKEAAPVFTGVRVQALGITEDFLSAGLKRVVLDGRGYAGDVKATFLSDGEVTGDEAPGKNQTSEFDLEVVVLGGSGKDTVKAGVGDAKLDGGAGNDALTTSDTAGRTVFVAGGAGNDGITTSNASATIAGDSALSGATDKAGFSVTSTRGPVALSGVVDWAALGAPGEGEGVAGGNDRIATGLGATTVLAGPGDDSVGIGADDPRAALQPAVEAYRSKGTTIVLGTGSDSAKGGTGADTIWTGPKTAAARGTLGGDHGVDTAGASDGAGLRNVVDTGSGGDTVYGSTAIDLVTGGSRVGQVDHLRGGGGRDVLLGGLGADQLFGGPAEDWVVAEPAAVGDDTGTDDFGAVRTYAKTPLPTGTTPSSKLLVGGDGADRVVGGNGSSTLFGDRYETAPCGDPAATPLSSQPVEPAGGADGRDLVLGGSGVDLVKAGGEADRVEAYAGADLVCGQGGDDAVFAADGADTVWGGSGADVAYGDTGGDRIFGNDGDDGLYGGPGTDVVEGGDGADDGYGGTEADTVVGGTRAAGFRDVGRDVLFGDDGADVLVGDNSTADGSYPVDLDGGLPLGDGDLVSGGAGNDTAHGGLGDDEVLGQLGQDDLEGNGGSDTVRGGDDDDQVVGGSSRLRTAPLLGWPDAGDLLYGDAGLDVIAGDNALLQRSAAPGTEVLRSRGLPDDQRVTLHDLGASAAGTFGDDAVRGLGGRDAVFGQAGDDDLFGDDAADLVEGGPGADELYGGEESDDLVGGSSALTPGTGTTQPDAGDTIDGGGGLDVITGDNAVLVLTAADAGTVVLQGRGFAQGRDVRLLDLGHTPLPGRSARDVITGAASSDAVFGQGGGDDLRGGPGDDLLEGGPGSDEVLGEDGSDDVVGGSSVLAPGTGEAGPQPDAGDVLDTGDGSDVVLGDNGALRRVGVRHPLTIGRTTPERGIDLHDLGDSADPRNAGGDLVHSGLGIDVALGQSGDDHADLGDGSDYAEGGPGSDLLQGRSGEDDLVGGSFTQLEAGGDPVAPGATAKGQPDRGDQLRGGDDDDVLTGDNAVLLRGQGAVSRVFQRLGSSGAPLTTRRLVLLDRENTGRLDAPAGIRFAGDQLAGGSGVDLAYGQDGPDLLSGGAADDYLQGNGGADLLRGDSSPEASSAAAKPAFSLGAVPAPPVTYDDGAVGPDGQDDVLGGSDVRGFRDGGDTVEGGGGDDAALGDNGSLVRTVVDGAERTYTARLRPTVERVAETGLLTAGESTRFCGVSGGQCEVAGASGADVLLGEAGDDGLWGQDGDDVVRGGDGDDDAFGELGGDQLFGDAGEDVLLGDRGGTRAARVTGAGVPVSQNAPPAEPYTAAPTGAYDRRVDLQNDTNGQTWLGSGTQTTMPLGGLVAGGRDRIRGGTGADQVHAGFGDDLANGDAGGDELFGDDGSDVLWGGKGCELGGLEDACAGTDVGQRGTGDRFVDHLMGGRGGAVGNTLQGADVLDWFPRGPLSGCSETAFPVAAGKDAAKDPCDWFRMTDKADADLTNDQHHQGTDWIYGGWDRDVMQGDLAANGPNPGDRLIDWNGVYNLYNHCNAAYGGFNDVRQHSPGMQDFLQVLAYGMGAGQTASEAATPGTSAFRELQMAYPNDRDVATGKPYPSSPGHFDDPVACTA